MTVHYRDLGLRGRLGNALFELAGSLAVGVRNKQEVRFPVNWIHRPYFNVPDEFFGPCTGIPAWEFMTHIDERVRPYMQDVNYFRFILPIIRDYLTPSALALEEINRNEKFFELEPPILSVHVRRGDNVPGRDPGVPDKHKYFVLPGAEFYHAAMGLLQHKANSIAVFSDDIGWCRENIKADYYHEGVPMPKEHEPEFKTAKPLDYVDLQLMANCDLHVITGSTYGIWGALLANSTRVVRPHEVYGPNLRYINSELLFLPEWKAIHVKGR